MAQHAFGDVTEDQLAADGNDAGNHDLDALILTDLAAEHLSFRRIGRRLRSATLPMPTASEAIKMRLSSSSIEHPSNRLFWLILRGALVLFSKRPFVNKNALGLGA